MKKLFTLLALVATSAFYFSCKKDNNSPNQPPPSTAAILGTWKFTGQNASRSIFNDFASLGNIYRLGTIYDVNTTGNGGTIQITANTIALNGISYQVTDSAETLEYTNGVVDQDFYTGMTADVGPLNGTYQYSSVGTDSISFANLDFVNAIAAFYAPVSSGAKFEINGKQLKITARSSKDSSYPYGTITIYENDTRKSVLTFEKQ